MLFVRTLKKSLVHLSFKLLDEAVEARGVVGGDVVRELLAVGVDDLQAVAPGVRQALHADLALEVLDLIDEKKKGQPDNFPLEDACIELTCRPEIIATWTSFMCANRSRIFFVSGGMMASSGVRAK